jgi:hypothetical protein
LKAALGVILLVVVLAVIGLVVALQLSPACFPQWLVLVVVGAVAAFVIWIFVLVLPSKNLQANDIQEAGRPEYPRYESSIRIVTVFFAAVLGFGLKHLLDLPTHFAKTPVEICNYKWVAYRWLFFLVATFIFLRLLTASANYCWLEYLKYERPYHPRDDLLIIGGFSWLTIFGCFGAYLCYADTPSQFFWRASYLLTATFVASVLQVLVALFSSITSRWISWTTPVGRWVWGWFVVNTFQLAAVLVLMKGGLGWTWDVKLLALGIVSAVILFFDVRWQLSLLARKLPQSVPYSGVQ